MSLPETVSEEVPHGRYEMLFAVDARYNSSQRSIDEDGAGFKERHTLEDCGRTLHSRVNEEKLCEVYPRIKKTSETVNIRRFVFESALIISAYDKTKPEKLIAQAEIRFVSYTDWQVGSIPIDAEQRDRFGINTPENYGYTTATLHDYWQLEDW